MGTEPGHGLEAGDRQLLAPPGLSKGPSGVQPGRLDVLPGEEAVDRVEVPKVGEQALQVRGQGKMVRALGSTRCGGTDRGIGCSSGRNGEAPGCAPGGGLTFHHEPEE